MERRTSLAFDLFTWWQSVPPGVGATMEEMLVGMDLADPQQIRNVLTQLRKGRVPDPSVRGGYCRSLPIRYNSADLKYYDFSNLSADTVAATIPGAILAEQFDELFTRIFTLESSMGNDGLVRSAQQLVDRPDIRRLIQQLPIEQIWRVQDAVQQIGRARQLLQLEERGAALLDAGAVEETDGD